MTTAYGNDRYLQMARAGRALRENSEGRPEIRIAILADHAPQQLSQVLKAAVAEQGFFPAVYEADYATAAPEAYDAGSGLHRFQADFVYVSLAMQKYRARFFSSGSPEAREALPAEYLREVGGIVAVLLGRGVGVVLDNLALPVERMFGNYGALTAQSCYGSVLKFNALLADFVGTSRGCQLNDVMFLANRVGTEAFLDERLWASSKYLCAPRFLPELAAGVARGLAARKGRLKKCIVLDLDNTLWGGVVGDDGIEGIKLGGDAEGEAFQAFQRYLLGLKQRGYVLAVCSKNNPETAGTAFRTHPEMIMQEEDVAIFVANWNDKASNLEYIARVLNLGLDSFVFVDDSPFERSQVRQALPMVAVPELPEDVADYVAALEAGGYFEATGLSEEDASRNQKYREEAQRSTEQIKYQNIDEYLASLGMEMQCGPVAPDDLARVAQLFQRSNQFNLRTQRTSEATCEQYLREPDRYLTLQLRLRDKFGDYGLISAACGEVRDGVLFVSELVMSCRVLKRGVEEYLMNHLFAQARRRGLKGVEGEYIRTEKNSLVRDFFPRFGFELVAGDDVRQVWRLALEKYQPRKTFITPANDD